MFYIGLIFVFVSLLFIFLAWREAIYIYKNPFPLFHNGDKRFSEIVKDKTKNYKTRSILKDAGYEAK